MPPAAAPPPFIKKICIDNCLYITLYYSHREKGKDMTTKMKSFRLDEWTASLIEETASEMNLSQSKLLTLAMEAFTNYGIDRTLNELDNGKKGRTNYYLTLIQMSSYSRAIEDEIKNQVTACNDHMNRSIRTRTTVEYDEQTTT